MLRAITDELCREMGRPITLRRGELPDLEFLGVLRGIRPDELVGSAQQGDFLCIIPAMQITGRGPRKFDALVANGRKYTIQFVRECFDGLDLCSYKVTVRG